MTVPLKIAFTPVYSKGESPHENVETIFPDNREKPIPIILNCGRGILSQTEK